MGWKMILDAMRFILAKSEPVVIRGDPIHDMLFIFSNLSGNVVHFVKHSFRQSEGFARTA